MISRQVPQNGVVVLSGVVGAENALSAFLGRLGGSSGCSVRELYLQTSANACFDVFIEFLLLPFSGFDAGLGIL